MAEEIRPSTATKHALAPRGWPSLLSPYVGSSARATVSAAATTSASPGCSILWMSLPALTASGMLPGDFVRVEASHNSTTTNSTTTNNNSSSSSSSSSATTSSNLINDNDRAASNGRSECSNSGWYFATVKAIASTGTSHVANGSARRSSSTASESNPGSGSCSSMFTVFGSTELMRNLATSVSRSDGTLQVNVHAQINGRSPPLSIQAARVLHFVLPNKLSGAEWPSTVAGAVAYSSLSSFVRSLLDERVVKVPSAIPVQWRGVVDWLEVADGAAIDCRKKTALEKSDTCPRAEMEVLSVTSTTQILLTFKHTISRAPPVSPATLSTLRSRSSSPSSPGVSLEERVAEMVNARLGGVNASVLKLSKHFTPHFCRGGLSGKPTNMVPSAVVTGPSGCGKSALLNAFACALRDAHGGIDLSILMLDAAAVYGGGPESGGSTRPEDAVRAVFVAARKRSPCVIIIDDLQSLAPIRSMQSTPMARAVCATLEAEIKICAKHSQLSAEATSTFPRPVACIGLAQSLSGIDRNVLNPDCLGAAIFEIAPLGQLERLDFLTVVFGRSISRPAKATTASSVSCTHDACILNPRRSVAQRPQLAQMLRWVATATVGFLAADLEALCREAILQSIASFSRNSNCLDSIVDEPTGGIQRQHFEAAMYITRPSQMKSTDRFADDVSQALEKPRLDELSEEPKSSRSWAGQMMRAFAHLPGLRRVHRRIVRSVLQPLAEPDLLRRFGVPNPRGVLLFGPPGTGKTATGLAMQTAVKGFANFICVTCTSIVDKELGATEKAIARAFLQARNVAPCILFLDQIEALAPVRGNDQSSELTFDRLLSCLLTEMDGVSSSANHDGNGSGMVIVVATTGRKEWLDPSILRPGRLDEHISLSLPDLKDRIEVLTHRLRGMPLQVDTIFPHNVNARPDGNNESDQPISQSGVEHSSSESDDLSDDDDIFGARRTCSGGGDLGAQESDQFSQLVQSIARETDGFSHADLCNGIQEAAMLALRDNIEAPTLRDLHLAQVFGLHSATSDV